MSRICIRAVQRKDLDQVVTIERLSMGTNTSPGVPYSKRQLDRHSQNKYFTVVEIDKKIVAYIGAERRFNQLEIWGLGVHPKWRRHGLGKDLVKRVVALGAKDLYKKARMTIAADNLRMKLLAEKLGFKQVGTIKDHFTEGSDGVVLTRDLAERV